MPCDTPICYQGSLNLWRDYVGWITPPCPPHSAVCFLCLTKGKSSHLTKGNSLHSPTPSSTCSLNVERLFLTPVEMDLMVPYVKNIKLECIKSIMSWKLCTLRLLKECIFLYKPTHQLVLLAGLTVCDILEAVLDSSSSKLGSFSNHPIFFSSLRRWVTNLWWFFESGVKASDKFW